MIRFRFPRPTWDQVAMVVSFAAIAALFTLVAWMYFSLRASFDLAQASLRGVL